MSQPLPSRDLYAVLDVVRACYAFQTLETYRSLVTAEVPKVVSCDIVTFFEIPVSPSRSARFFPNPPVHHERGVSEEILVRHMHEHPRLVHYRRTGDGRALRISDLVDRSAFHRLRVYNEFLRLVDVEYELTAGLAPSRDVAAGLALCRSRRDFTGRELALVDVLRPHLIAAYRNAQALSALEDELARASRMMFTLTPHGRVQGVHERARLVIERYFGSTFKGDTPPEPLSRWLRLQKAQLLGTDDLPPPRAPLVLEGDRGTLVIRFISAAECDVLVLEERPKRIDPGPLQAHGLTRREAEVLAAQLRGSSTSEVGAQFGMRRRTVEKHLEHIYRKLAVNSRTGAIAQALRLLGLIG